MQATVCLHNYLRLTDNAMYCAIGFVDSEDSSGESREGDWRTIVAADQGAFQNIETPRGRPQNDANLVRESLTSYFLTDRGSGSGNTLGALGLIWRLLNGDKLNYLLKVYILASENP